MLKNSYSFFTHLLKHDFRLLVRNQIISISLGVSALYIGVFYLLKSIIPVEKVLVLLIFNDPALLGFLFIGVLILFEKNENTLQVLQISPIKVQTYIWSKSISLALVALLCCLAMVCSAYGFAFNWIHFTAASLFTSMIYSFFGFYAIQGQTVFNEYLLRMAWIIILLAIPFISYFGLVDPIWFYWHPTYSVICLFDVSLNSDQSWLKITYAYASSFLWLFISYKWAVFSFSKDFKPKTIDS